MANSQIKKTIETTTEKPSMNCNFTLPYDDLLLDNAPMLALITAAMDGEFKDVDPEKAFHDLTKAQTKYFSNLIIRIYTRALKKKADAEITAKMREVTIWSILPSMKKHVEAAMVGETTSQEAVN